MTTLLDSNVLIALVVIQHVHHGSAERWLSSLEGPFATCPSTQGSLLRLLVREGIVMAAAVDALGAFIQDRRHEFWADDLPYTVVQARGIVGHRQVTDAYLAQLARQRRGRLATLDRGLAAVHADVAEVIPA
ncbi:MAG TPA: TA system VapC family ribonuclease toxin [Chloroflexota bacterium]|nr:TA system VapC family ribonuclease toxin [Chloroflexota bacterium]